MQAGSLVLSWLNEEPPRAPDIDLRVDVEVGHGMSIKYGVGRAFGIDHPERTRPFHLPNGSALVLSQYENNGCWVEEGRILLQAAGRNNATIT